MRCEIELSEVCRIWNLLKDPCGIWPVIWQRMDFDKYIPMAIFYSDFIFDAKCDTFGDFYDSIKKFGCVVL